MHETARPPLLHNPGRHISPLDLLLPPSHPGIRTLRHIQARPESERWSARPGPLLHPPLRRQHDQTRPAHCHIRRAAAGNTDQGLGDDHGGRRRLLQDFRPCAECDADRGRPALDQVVGRDHAEKHSGHQDAAGGAAGQGVAFE